MIKYFLTFCLSVIAFYASATDKQNKLLSAFNEYAKASPYERVNYFSQEALAAIFDVLMVKKTDEEKLEHLNIIYNARINYIDKFSIVDSTIKVLESENAVTLVAISKKHNKSKQLTYTYVFNPNKGWLINKVKNGIIDYPYQQQTNNQALKRTP